MSLLADPRICPDCRADLDPARTCTGCGLALRGPDASELWTTMVRADDLVEKLRRGPAPVPAATEFATAMTAGLPQAPPAPARYVDRAPRGVSSLSVQVVLLGVGGLCLLVAATVFVAVNWSSLGLAGRTLVMTGITGLVGLVAVVLTRRALRGGAETLWLLTGALVTIDLVAARWAGLLGHLDPRHVAGLTGLVLLVGAAGAYAWAGMKYRVRLDGMVIAAAIGTVTVTAAEAWAAPAAAVATAIAVPLLVAAGLVLDRPRAGSLRPIAYVVGAVGGLSWWVLFLEGLQRTGVGPGDWWHHLHGWPLLVAALWAAVPTLLGRLRASLRYAAATASLVSLSAFVLGAHASGNGEVLLVSGVALVLALVTAFAPLIWARPAGGLTAAAVVTAVVLTVVRPFGVLALLPSTAPARGAHLGQRLPDTSWTLAAWTAPVIAAVAVLTALSLVRHLDEDSRTRARSAWNVVAAPLLGIGLVMLVLENRPSLLSAVTAWVALLGVTAVLTFLARTRAPALAGGLAASYYLVGLGLRLAVPSHLLVALLATLAAAVLATAAARARIERLDGALVPLLAGPAVLLAGFAATHWPYVADARGDTAGLALALVMATAGLSAAPLGRTPATRVTIESAALLGAVLAPFFAVEDLVVALTLTIAGSAVALVSILNRDRDQLSWLAVVLLGTATALRLADGASAPELVAVPAACLLLAAGVWRLRHDDQVTSRRALGSGLSLGLVPSLLLVLDDPVSLRGVLLAGAALAVLALGIAERWGAPFLAGATVVAILAARHLGPVAAALPRWISLGSVGLALLLVGVSWEARRRDAAVAERYLAALR
ncbi:MAG: hypothetical protein JWP74_4103 [Marmoricola sp.]|nr:hypothetical protein [Marmoricola sp.]